MRTFACRLFWMLYAILFLYNISSSGDTLVNVLPEYETRSQTGVKDADDICIWVHPSVSSQSVVIGTDKDTGISVYDLNGRELHHYPVGRINNIDIRYNIPLGREYVDLVAGSNRSDNTIAVYRIDPDTRALVDIAAGPIRAGMDVYGFCLYRSRETGKLYGLLTSELGPVEQWELKDNGSGKIEGAFFRRFGLPSQCEGCVADDELGVIYIAEEERGIWAIPAEKEIDEASRVLVAKVGEHLKPDIEGLTIYHTSGSFQYLIASCQGVNSFSVFRLDTSTQHYVFGWPIDYLGSFRIAASNGIDSVEHTDGIDVVNAALGSRFPSGLFAAQDGHNQDGDSTNFKFVSWEQIAKAFAPPLRIDTQWNPRTNTVKTSRQNKGKTPHGF